MTFCAGSTVVSKLPDARSFSIKRCSMPKTSRRRGRGAELGEERVGLLLHLALRPDRDAARRGERGRALAGARVELGQRELHRGVAGQELAGAFGGADAWRWIAVAEQVGAAQH